MYVNETLKFIVKKKEDKIHFLYLIFFFITKMFSLTFFLVFMIKYDSSVSRNI